MAMIQGAYKEKMAYFNKAETNLGENLETSLTDVDEMIGRERNVVEGQRTGALEQLTGQEQEAGQRKVSALDDASRLYNELFRGGQQRFGGASSAGEAFKAIGGQQLQRNRQQIGEQFQQFMGTAAQAKRQIQQQTSIALQNLESRTTSLKNQARQQFQNQLLEIERMRANTESEKAAGKLQALQELRNQQFQIDLQLQQQRAELQQQSQNLNREIEELIKAKVEGLNNLPNEAPTQNPQVTHGVDQITPTMAYTGIKTGRDEEEGLFNTNPVASYS